MARLSSLDRHVPEFLNLIREFEQRFRVMDAEAVNGPHEALSLQELRLVEFLGEGGRKIMKDLAAHLILAVNSVTSLVDNLEKKGYVARQRSTEDRRVIHVDLTAAGRELLASASQEKQACIRWLLGGLTAAERDTFIQLFRKMARVEAPPPAKK
jgi:DNA-binding MarR family transcriptional regulator